MASHCDNKLSQTLLPQAQYDCLGERDKSRTHISDMVKRNLGLSDLEPPAVRVNLSCIMSFLGHSWACFLKTSAMS